MLELGDTDGLIDEEGDVDGETDGLIDGEMDALIDGDTTVMPPFRRSIMSSNRFIISYCADIMILS